MRTLLEKWWPVSLSRRAQITLTAILVVVLREYVGLDEETAGAIALSLMSWVVSQGFRPTPPRPLGRPGV